MSDQSQDPQQQQQGKPSRARRGQQQGGDPAPEQPAGAGAGTAVAEPQQADTHHDDDELDEFGQAPGPEQPQEVEIRASDNGVVFFGVAVRDEDVDPSDLDEAFLAGRQGPAPEDRDEADPISGEQVEFLTGAADGHALVLVVNGQAFAFSKQMVGSLKNIVDKTVVGLAL